MNTILVLVILAGVSIFSVAFLQNDIELWNQDYGVGDGDIPSPIMASNLNILITRVDAPTTHFDFITGCEFTSVDKVLAEGTTLYCKLLQGLDVRTATPIAIGFKMIGPGDLPANTPTIIDIDTNLFSGANNVNVIQHVVVEIQDP